MEALFHQLETDLRYLARHLQIQDLIRALGQQLRDKEEIVNTAYEVYVAALLASVSDEIQLHVPTRGKRNCDFRVKIHGHEIYGDVKTRDDKFPFNTPSKKDDSGENLYIASRATVDPHVADGGGHPELDKTIPESTVLRQIIEKAVTQLPQTHSNLMIIGFIGDFNFPSKIREELESALLGDDFDLFRDRQYISMRHPNGILTDPRYGKQISSVAWLSLRRSSSGIVRRSGIFFYPNAKHRLPQEVEMILEHLFDREKTLKRELDRIVDKISSVYRPKKIILFGSLAQGSVKEGSDIDLAIIKDTDKKPLDRSLEVSTISQPSLAVNFLVYTPQEFQQEQERGNFFIIDEILKRGRVLYER